MDQILIHVTGVILGAITLKVLRLNTRKVIISHPKPVSWIWKALALIGKFTFYYGCLIFLTNLAFVGVNGINTRLGASIFSIGLVFWIFASVIIYFKRN